MPNLGPPNNPQPITIKVRDLLTDAFIEAGWIAPGEVMDAGNEQFGLRKLNRICRSWAAKKAYVWTTSFQLFTMVANKSPLTIGPDKADFYMFVRPVRIESAAFILNPGSQPVDVPIKIVDDDWWAANPVKSLATTIDTYLYYSADVPNGKLFFWPICNSNAQVRLQTWSTVEEFSSLDQPVLLPPGYDEALLLTLASGLDGPRSPSLAQDALMAKRRILSNNDPPPRIDTGGGMPGSSSGDWRFNFLTREPHR